VSGEERTSNIEHPTSNTEREESRIAHHASRCYFLCLFSFALGLMSKPMLVTLPFVMLLLDWWPLRRVSGVRCQVTSIPIRERHMALNPQLSTLNQLVVEKIPFFALSAVSCLVTFLVQQKGGALKSLTKYSVSARTGNAFVSYARYLEKTFWPVSLANPYPYVKHWPWEYLLPAVALLAGLCVAAVWLGRKYPFGFTGWFWFVGTLVPVIGLVQVGGQSMSDRYSYLPLVGLFVILAWGGWELWSRWRLPQSFLVLAVLLLLAAGAWQTRIQVGYWQNTEQLFRHALAVTQNNHMAWNNLGIYLSSQGQVTEAMDCYAKSLQIDPDNSDALYNLGNAFARSGNLDGAMDNYRRALQIAPTRTDILNNLGIALASQKQFTDATACFEKALKLNPDYADAHNNFATVLFIQKRFDEAIRHLREALRLTPDNPQIYSNLGDALMKQGQTAEAVRCYQEALRLKPGDPKIKARLQSLGAPVSIEKLRPPR
jgi:Tfp pilus assembly protein PilF